MLWVCLPNHRGRSRGPVSILQQLHLKLFSTELDDIAIYDLLAPSGFNLTIHGDLAIPYEEFSLATCSDQPLEFEDFVELDGLPVDFNYSHWWLPD